MLKIEAKKDGQGNIIVSEDSFEMLLACLDNQKFVGEQPQNGDSISIGFEKYWSGQKDIQNAIDYYNREFRKILHQKYLLNTEADGYYLVKKYEHQTENIEWSYNDVLLVMEIFKDTKMPRKEDIVLPQLDDSEPQHWLIERALWSDNIYLIISENGMFNRPWKQEEIDKIQNKLNGNI